MEPSQHLIVSGVIIRQESNPLVMLEAVNLNQIILQQNPPAVNMFGTGKENGTSHLNTGMINPIAKVEDIDPSEVLLKQEPNIYVSDILKIEENEEIFTAQSLTHIRNLKRVSELEVTAGTHQEANKLTPIKYSRSSFYDSLLLADDDDIDDEIKYGVESEFQFGMGESDVTHASGSSEVENDDKENSLPSFEGLSEKTENPLALNSLRECADVTSVARQSLSDHLNEEFQNRTELDEALIRKRVEGLLPQNQRFPIGQYRCHSCEKEFTLLTEWENHIVEYLAKRGCYPHKSKTRQISQKRLENEPREQSDGRWMCHLCSYVAQCRSRVSLHTAKIHIDKKLLLPCAICSSKFINFFRLNYHLKRSHDPSFKPFQCFHCNFRTQQKCDIKIHILRNHMKGRTLKCKFCYKRTTSVGIMRRHVLSKHTAILNRNFICTKCSFSTMYKKELSRHVRDNHLVEDITYFCFYCPYKRNIKKELQGHIVAAHRNEVQKRKIKCKRCHMMFFSEISWKTHFRAMHTEKEESFLCKLCGSDFTAKSLMFVHMNVEHLKRKKFQCLDCKFLGPDIHSLSKHVFVNHSVVFFCAHCNYTSNTKAKMLKHIEHRHLPLGNQFKCKKCKYIAKSHQLLRQHTNVRHCPNPIWYTCFHCGHKNKIKHKMSQHMQTKHRDILRKKKSKS